MSITVFILCFLFLVVFWGTLDVLSCLFPGQLLPGWIKSTSGFGCVVQVMCSEETILELFVKQIFFSSVDDGKDTRFEAKTCEFEFCMPFWLIVWHWAINLIFLCFRVSLYEIRNNNTSCLCLILSVAEGKGGKWE